MHILRFPSQNLIFSKHNQLFRKILLLLYSYTHNIHLLFLVHVASALHFLKVASATLDLYNVQAAVIIKSCSFQNIFGTTFLSFPATSFTFFDFYALVLHILSQEIIEANTILRINIIAGIILMSYANALAWTRAS